MEKVIVIYSGGMDSFTLLNKLVIDGYDVHAVSFNYGQRHSKELDYAGRVTAELGIEHKIVDVSSINQLLQGSALTSDDMDVPEGHYEEPSMKQTVVPNRNMIMLSLAVGYAVSIGASKVYYGAHGGDHAVYPDCRPEFIDAMNAVTKIANWEPVEICTPFIDAGMDKGDIAAMGKTLELDYGKSWTCYKGGDKPCGKCGACQERIEAMAFAGINDPEYG